MRSIPRACVFASVGFINIVLVGACFGGPDSDLKESQSSYTCTTEVEVECTKAEELALDAVSGLGFSASDVLPSIVGNYEIPIRWVSPCVEVSGCTALADCSRFAEQPPVSMAGTTTALSLELTASGPAEVMAPGPGQDACGQSMLIPGALSVRTEDGAVDTTLAVVIWTECGSQLSVTVSGPATQLGGTLGAELGDDVQSQLTFGATQDALFWFQLSFVRHTDYTPRPVTLWGEMLLGDAICYQSVPRRDVLSGAE